MVGLAAGGLDRRITIERAVPVDDGYQIRDADWSIFATTWAQYRPGKGSERFAAAAQSSSQPVAFWTRWSKKLATVTTSDRVRFDGRVYDISAATEIGRRDGLEFMCVTSDDGSAGTADA